MSRIFSSFAVEDPWLVEGLEKLANAVNLRTRLYPLEYLLVCLPKGVVRPVVGGRPQTQKKAKEGLHNVAEARRNSRVWLS